MSDSDSDTIHISLRIQITGSHLYYWRFYWFLKTGVSLMAYFIFYPGFVKESLVASFDL